MFNVQGFGAIQTLNLELGTLNRKISVAEENKQAFAKLKRFVEPRQKPRSGNDCEFCGVDIADEHSHVVNAETRSLMCVCRPCYLLFTREGAARGKYKAVSRTLSICAGTNPYRRAME